MSKIDDLEIIIAQANLDSSFISDLAALCRYIRAAEAFLDMANKLSIKDSVIRRKDLQAARKELGLE